VIIVATLSPALTDAHRSFLNDPAKRQMLMRDFTLYFIHKFNLCPHAAGRLLAQWVREL
jgi:hypothetical protein